MDPEMFCMDARVESFNGKWPFKSGKCVPKKVC